MLTRMFQCPDCRARLRQDSGALVCDKCAGRIALFDGVADFVRGRFDTTLDAHHYDLEHGIGGGSSTVYYDRIKTIAGPRWPASLGAVVEIGCGTGLFSRALAERGEATSLLLTDVSIPMLHRCRLNIEASASAPPQPVAYATYSSHENCLRDAVFDTCIGTSALHHIPDIRAFLADIFRALKPGGRVFFVEPNRRFDLAASQTLADVLAALFHRDPEGTEDRQKILNVLAEFRRRLLHQGDIAFLSGLEDKHMFLAEEFEEMALGLGFATAAAIPASNDPPWLVLRRLCAEIGVTATLAQEVAESVQAVSGRYFDLLSPRDASQGFLLWMTKSAAPQLRQYTATPPAFDAALIAHTPATAWGGDLPHWTLELKARRGPDGLLLDVYGWCLAQADILWVAIAIDGITRKTPVWLPRQDVQTVINHTGLYPAWNALCSGVGGVLDYAGLHPRNETVTATITLELADGTLFAACAPTVLNLDEVLALP